MATPNKRGAPDRCRGCGKKIHADDPRIVRVSLGQLHGVEDGLEDFDEQDGEVWGYMHERCFYLAVGDPQAIRMMVPTAAPAPA
jgi:hypothetical protein